MESKRYRLLERIFKGVANHRRVQILDLLKQKTELSVGHITEKLGINFRTASEHIRKLVLAGLVMKRHEGVSVRHALTKRSRDILKFCRILE